MTETSFHPRFDAVCSLAGIVRLGERLLPRHRLLRLALSLAGGTLATVAVIGLPILIYAGAIQLTGNIDTVVRDKVYRSATLGAADLAAVIRAGHIRTVINLRGANPGHVWYDDEVRVTAADHVRLIDIPMSAIREPSPDVLAKLIETLKTAETPMLIHCSSGSDRTGLAAGLYRLLVEHEPVRIAVRQLSFYWGHFPWLGSPTVAMDRTFAKVVAGLKPVH
jgi:protein tyrosine phosphatase (PTP) superfamily phosphohydrolase (DUF442 family)